MKLPEHKCGLFLTHNEHRDYYEPLAQYIESGDLADTFESPEAMQRAIDTDEHWHLQWYPRTPVSFYEVSAPTLEELLRLANEDENTEEALSNGNEQGRKAGL